MQQALEVTITTTADNILKYSFILFFRENWTFTFHLNQLLPKQFRCTLQKHAYSNTLKILPPKNESFQIKNSDIFHVSVQNIDCGYLLELPHRCSSNDLCFGQK